MDSIKLVIFDLAGTIVEDHGEVLDAFAAALAKHGIPHTAAELREWKGASKLEVIRHFVQRQVGPATDESVVAAAYADFRSGLDKYYRDGGVCPIQGAGETLQWLRQRGIRMATTSGFYREVSSLILELAGWSRTFDANVSSSDVPSGRPAPYMIFRAMEGAGVTSVRAVINVGDTPLDLQAGTNAGVREVVGVLTGVHGRERLQREPHTGLLASVADLPAWMERRDCRTSAPDSTGRPGAAVPTRVVPD